MLSPKYFTATAARFGSSQTTTKFIGTVATIAAGAAAVCYYLRLEWYYIIGMCIFTIAMAPSILITLYKNKYENLRFEEATNYCEQMIYSFKKRHKIRVALIDVLGTSTGHLKEVVQKMIDYIDNGESINDLYAEAFDIMQNEYDCSRIDTLHNYLKEVEEHGGDPDRAITILLDDVRQWSTMILVFQRKREAVRKKVGISIVLALFTCSMMFNFIPAEYIDGIITSPIYQAATSFVLVMCELTYLFISNKIAGTYLDNEQRKGEINNALRWVHKLEKYDKKKEQKNTVIFCIGLVAAAAVMQFILELGYISLAPLVAAGYFIFDFMTKESNIKKKITKEINIVFPMWLRNLILHLQTDNVHVALKNSMRSCPEVLRPEVKKLLVGISNEPNSIVPYTQFLKGYDLPEFKSAIKFLYSLAEFGSDDMITQLDQLVQQNAALTATGEELSQESHLSALNTLTFAPMLIACVKLLIDLGLFFTTFMGYMGNLGM